jgi:hypothetical protein
LASFVIFLLYMIASKIIDRKDKSQ